MTHSLLLIEDDAPTARLIRVSLDRNEFSIEVEPDREKALEFIGRRRPDAIVMDYVMGGMSAESFIEKARASGFDGPIVLCTAMHTSLDLDVADVIHKPFDPDELGPRLRAVIERT
jgi:DNA-binding response OmpR family regulator